MDVKFRIRFASLSPWMEGLLSTGPTPSSFLLLVSGGAMKAAEEEDEWLSELINYLITAVFVEQPLA